MNYDFRNWAIAQHEKTNQTYGGILALPYSFHLECVYRQLVWFRPNHTQLQMDGCFGHDLIEDARVTYNDIKMVGGEELAELIFACTELRGRNRAERHGAEYLEGLRRNSDAALVKLCDIAANVQFSRLTGSSMFHKYRSEWGHFADTVHHVEYADIYEHIDRLLAIRQEFDIEYLDRMAGAVEEGDQSYVRDLISDWQKNLQSELNKYKPKNKK